MQNTFSKNGASGIQENLGISFQYKVTAKFKPPVSVPGSRKECFVCQRGFCPSGYRLFIVWCRLNIFNVVGITSRPAGINLPPLVFLFCFRCWFPVLKTHSFPVVMNFKILIVDFQQRQSFFFCIRVYNHRIVPAGNIFWILKPLYRLRKIYRKV